MPLPTPTRCKLLVTNPGIGEEHSLLLLANPDGGHPLVDHRVEGPRRHQDALYIMYSLVLCDKRAQYVGILRQSGKEGKKT